MEGVVRIGRFLKNAGFTVCIGASLYALFGADRTRGMLGFVLGFLACIVGVTLMELFGDWDGKPSAFKRYLDERIGIESYEPSPLGRTILGIGLALLFIPTTIGTFLLGKTDDDVAVFWWTGSAVTIVGMLILIVGHLHDSVHRR